MTKTASAKRKRAEREAQKSELPSRKRTKVSDDVEASGAWKAAKVAFEKIPFAENPTSEDRKREAALYEQLGSEDVNERIEAADAIISSLLDGEGVHERVLEKHLDRRLFRGLASGRNASRLGFSLVITELLSQLFGDKALSETDYRGMTFDTVLGFLVEKMNTGGNIPGQEERGYFFGQLFGIECFVRAGVLFRDTDRWLAVLDLLMKLGNRKVWLKAQCGWVIASAVPQMNEEQAHQTLHEVLRAKWAKTPEAVGIWLVILKAFPDLEDEIVQNFLASKALPELALILKESFREEAEEKAPSYNKNKQANWTPQLHFVWDLLKDHFLAHGDENPEPFRHFWNRVVDDSFFSKTATDGQKFRGFSVFQKMLEGLVECDTLLDILFSKNLMTCLMNQASQEDRYLHRAAIRTLKTVETVAQSHPEAAGVILENLISKNGNYSFDLRTKTKTVETILQQVKPEAGEDVMGVLSGPVMKMSTTGNDIKKVKLELRVYIEYLFKLTDSAPEPALQELTALAYANPIWIPENASAFVKELSRARLQSAFAKLSRKAEDSGYLCAAIQSISPDYIRMDDAIKSEVQEARKRLHTLTQQSATTSADGKPSQEAKIAHGLALLHAVAIFQLYNEEPDAFQLLGDLKEYQTRLRGGPKIVDGADEEGTSEFLVEILLSIVSQPSSLLRQVSEQVFGCFTSRVSGEALVLLADVLHADESAKGQQALFNLDGDDIDPDEAEAAEDDSDDELGSDVEIDSDVEFVTLNTTEAADEEDEAESDEADGEEEADEDETNQIEALDDALGKLLNSHRLDRDKEADSSDDDEDMSDSEMLELDNKLAEVFKHRMKNRPNKKKERKAAKESVVNFKRRVLDLLDIYIKNEAANPLALSTLLPLLQLIRTSTIKSLTDRAHDIVGDYQRRLKKARSNRKEEGPVLLDDVSATLQLLKEVHAEAAMGESHLHAKAAASANLIVASTIFLADEGSRKDLQDVFDSLQPKLRGKKDDSLQGKMCQDWEIWVQNFNATKGK